MEMYFKKDYLQYTGSFKVLFKRDYLQYTGSFKVLYSRRTPSNPQAALRYSIQEGLPQIHRQL